MFLANLYVNKSDFQVDNFVYKKNIFLLTQIVFHPILEYIKYGVIESLKRESKRETEPKGEVFRINFIRIWLFFERFKPIKNINTKSRDYVFENQKA